MKRWIMIAAVAATLPVVASAGEGTMPPPVFKVKVTARVAVESGGFRYTYNVENTAESTLGMSGIVINVGPVYGDVSPQAPSGSGWIFFPIPETWHPKSSICFLPAQPSPPGAQVSGFTLLSKHPPGIVVMDVTSWTDPWFDAYYAKFGYYPDDPEQDEIKRNATAHVPVLGPMGAPPGTFAHWDRYLADVTKAVKLSWIPDAQLAGQIQDLLSQARHAAGRGDSAAVTSLLDQAIAVVKGASADQITEEGRELVRLNAQYLKNAQATPYEPVLDLVRGGERNGALLQPGEWKAAARRRWLGQDAF